ncbi:hypothetical protein F8R89_30560 [Streptomyces sp. SS1-1]|uniref:hypothetical protein n=1 Tax=Streptomyces sp. SS1-1 TaxID=2651869 RepID=UPI00125016B0|nr:hypothetical protein [Streptomyces sp. SS1-1]KAB2975955.1 hypothetical protein F8R89_30560 [Streptomyces sp. SS1-1]
MVALLALMAVVAFAATAGLPWWVVALVTVLLAGFVGGMSWSPGRGQSGGAARGPARRPAHPMADRDTAVTPAETPVGAAPPMR